MSDFFRFRFFFERGSFVEEKMLCIILVHCGNNHVEMIGVMKMAIFIKKYEQKKINEKEYENANAMLFAKKNIY